MKHWYGILLCCTSILYAQDGRNIHRYFWANRLQFGGNTKEAQRWYNEIFKSQAPLQTYVGYLHFLFDMHHYDKIVAIAPTLQEKLQDNAPVQLIIALAYRKTNNKEESFKRLVELNKKFKAHPEITFYTVESLIEHKELENALYVINEYLESSSLQSRTFIFHFIKAQIYTQLGKSAHALQEIHETLKINPHFDKAWLVFAALQEEAGQLNEAIKGYSTFLQLNGSANKKIEHHLLQLLFKQKLMTDEKVPSLSYRGPLERALLAFKEGDLEQASSSIEIYLAQHPSSSKGRLLKIQILSAQKKHGQAIALIHQWINEDPTNAVWYQLLHLMGRTGAPLTSIIATLEKIAQAHPQQLLPHLYLADLYLRAHDNKALDHLNQAEELAKDTALKTRILFQTGVIHYEHKNYAQMEVALEKGLELKEDYPPLLNLLAYYYATHQTQLEKATSLINKALEKDPHNPHFLDTKAVIFYKQNKFNESLTLLAHALEKEPNDSTILIHAAKVLHALGEKEKARSTILHAQTHAKTSYEKETSMQLAKLWNT